MSRQVVAALLIAITVPLSAWGQKECPEIRKKIEELPYFDTWNNCSPEANALNVKAYTSKSCFLDTTPGYSASDVVYELKLHEGNQVAFLLTPIVIDDKPKRDFVLTVLDICGDGSSCISSSTDFIGTDPEQISAVKYSAGIHYLNVDSVEDDQCGWYQLSVFGVNPTPRFDLIMTTKDRAVAGKSLTYDFKIDNGGGKATNVVLEHTLPPNIKAKSYSPGCKEVVEKVVCLKSDDTEFPWEVSVTVDIPPDADSRITSSARVRAAEGVPAESKTTSFVRREHDLSIDLSTSSGEAIAGERRTYILTLRNDGPSDAADVEAIDKLDPKEHWESGDCEDLGSTVLCGNLALKAKSELTRTFTVKIDSSAVSLSNQATVGSKTGSEPGKNKGPNTDRLDAIVGRKTDFTIGDIKTEPAGPIPAGSPFDYVIPVRNNGPSDSSGGTLTVELSESLCLAGSTGDCPPGASSVTFTIPPIGAGDTKDFRLSVETAPTLGMATLSSKARVTASENAPAVDDNRTFTTDFIVEADLRVADVEDTESVCEGENVLYTIKVHNDGDSKSSEGTVTSELDGLSFVASFDGCQAGNDNRTVICPTRDLPVGGEVEVRFRALATRSGTVKNTVSAEGEHDPDHEPGVKEETTVSAVSDLEVALSASEDPLKPNQLFTYEVAVTNHGPSAAEGVSVKVTLPDGVTSEPGEGCSVCESPCTLGLENIEVDGTGKKKICARAPAQIDPIKASASIVDRPCDPNENSTELLTTVAAETDADLSVTLTANENFVSGGSRLIYTLLVVNHGFAQAEGVKVEVTLPDGVCLVQGEDCAPDAPKVVLDDVGSLAANKDWTRTLTVKVASTAGHLIETSAKVSADTPIDPNTSNNSDKVVTQQAADTDLCGSWSVRFFNGQPVGSRTELLFFVPGHSGGAVATGRVFTESGAFVEEIEAPSTQETFHYQVDVPVGSGSIEWTFKNDRLGRVAAIHTLLNGDKVTLPGFCRKPERPGAKILVLPFFETNPAVNTHVAVRNETDKEVKVRVTFSGSPEPALFLLAGHAVRTANLRNLLGNVEGSLEFVALDPADEEQLVNALSGDFIRVSPEGLTGSALEEKPPGN